jgi:hypothetical protein
MVLELKLVMMILAWLGMLRVDTLQVFQLLRVESILGHVHGVMPWDPSALSNWNFKGSRQSGYLKIFVGLSNRVNGAQASSMVVHKCSSLTNLLIEGLPNSSIDLIELLPS